MILPIDDFSGNSSGEELVWKNFKSLLPENYISFHNYSLGFKQVDVILLVPKLGILIIEIKGILSKNIYDVPDNTIIRCKNNPPIPSPYAQATKYRNILLNDYLLKNEVNDIYAIQCVCYPYITNQDFLKTGLNKISSPELTLVSEDFESSITLINKINSMFEIAYERIEARQLEKYSFSSDKMNKVGNLISPNFNNIKFVNEEKKLENVSINKKIDRKVYSRLITIINTSTYTEEIDSIINCWLNGTKVIIFTNSLDLKNRINENIKTCLKNNKLENNYHFKLLDGNTFNFSVFFIENIVEEFEIVDGFYTSKQAEVLQVYNNASGFNKNQYDIEHAEDTNIIVKAGAGTGKTYSIISRINFLIYKNQYDAENMKNAIAMITFTNDSADSMRKRLLENFTKYYLLTMNNMYLDFIECVSDMYIATIHSMSKLILNEYSTLMGYGRDIQIVSGKLQRQKILRKNLNQVEMKKEDFGTETSNYQLIKSISNFQEKLDNKNISLKERSGLNFGKTIIGRFDKYLNALSNSEKEFEQYCADNNSVYLGSIIRKLSELINVIKSEKIQINTKIDYLFVDEFQDTDDVQIKLINDFRQIFNYKIFVVGDVKQCIYRFRGAETKAFDILKKADSSKYLEISLNKNYRTGQVLLENMNQVFTKWDSDKRINYKEDEILKSSRSDESHHIERIEFSNDVDLSEKLVKKVVDEKKKLTPKGRIAILVRYNSDVEKIKKVFNERNIFVETDVGGDLFRIDPTIDLYKLVIALRNYSSPKHLYNLYTSSYVSSYVNKVKLINFKGSKECHFYKNLSETIPDLKDYLERIKREPTLKVIRDIVDKAKPWQNFSNSMIKRIGNITQDEKLTLKDRYETYYIKNLDLLFEKLTLASNTDYITLNKIADYLEVMILSRRNENSRETFNVEKNQSEILCTTVHKAKGLEFETVILPYCEFDITKIGKKAEVDIIYSGNDVGYKISKNIENTDQGEIFKNDIYIKYENSEKEDKESEETRILYVAITRSIKRFVYFGKANGQERSTTWNKLISEGMKCVS